MSRPTTNAKRVLGPVAMFLGLALGFTSVVSSAGCDYLDSGYGYWPDYNTVQSVLDYRQSVYDNANAAWDAYILE